MADKKTPPNSPQPVKAVVSPVDKMTVAGDSTIRYMGAKLYTGGKGCVSDFSQLNIGDHEKITRVLLLGEEEKKDIIHPLNVTNYHYVQLKSEEDPLASGALAAAHAYIDESEKLGLPTLVCGGYGMVRAPFVVATYRMLKEEKSYAETRDNMLSYLDDDAQRKAYFQDPSQFKRCAELLEKIKTVDYSAIRDDNHKRELYAEYQKQLKRDIDAATQEEPRNQPGQ